MIEPSVPGWRIRAGIGVAAVAGLVAIAGGMSAGLETSSGWSNEASAAVVPEVLYLEEDTAKLATIARVNGDIADEVTVDVSIDRLTRRTPAETRPSSTNSVMDAPGAHDPSSSKDERTAPDGAADDSGNGNGGGNGNETGPATMDATPKAGEPAVTPAPRTEPKTEPKTEDPGTPPTTTVPVTDPDTGSGNSGGGNAPDNRGKPTEDRDKRTVDAKSTDQTAKEQTP